MERTVKFRMETLSLWPCSMKRLNGVSCREPPSRVCVCACTRERKKCLISWGFVQNEAWELRPGSWSVPCALHRLRGAENVQNEQAPPPSCCAALHHICWAGPGGLRFVPGSAGGFWPQQAQVLICHSKCGAQGKLDWQPLTSPAGMMFLP